MSAEAQHRKYPKTFQIPDKKERYGLEKNDLAKVIFTAPKTMGERMWVMVTKVKGNGSYEGKLDNKPVVYTQLRLGSKINFHARNVIDIWKD